MKKALNANPFYYARKEEKLAELKAQQIHHQEMYLQDQLSHQNGSKPVNKLYLQIQIKQLVL